MTARNLAFWTAFALLAPLMLLQAAWVTRTARRLPAGAGAVDGIVGAAPGTPLTLLFVGESPVAGVGCTTMDESIAAATARELAHRLGRPVHWHAAGVNGLRIRRSIDELLPRLPRRAFDFVVAVHGVNDTTGLTPLPAWREALAELAIRLTAAHRARVVYTQVAPMHRFTALPQPLRAVVGLRARVLDDALDAHPARNRLFEVVDAEIPMDPGYLAADGYHPSPAGCTAWGRAVGAALARLVQPNSAN